MLVPGLAASTPFPTATSPAAASAPSDDDLPAALSPGRTASDIIRLATDCGLQAIEWSADGPFDVDDPAAAAGVHAECRAAGLGVCAYDSGYRAGVDNPATFTAALRTAKALHAGIVHVRAGAVSSVDASVADWARAMHALREAAAAATQAGIRVSLRHEPGTVADTTASMTQLRREVHHDTVGFHWQSRNGRANEDILAEFRSLLPALRVVQVGGTVANTPPATTPPVAGAGHQATALTDRAALWQPLLEEFAASPDTRFALLSLHEGITLADLQRDAATMIGWLPREPAPA